MSDRVVHCTGGKLTVSDRVVHCTEGKLTVSDRLVLTKNRLLMLGQK